MGSSDEARKPMPLSVVGLSHKVAPVTLREAFSLSPADTKTALRRLADRLHGEVVILSTCNRLEIYTCATAATTVRDAILDDLSSWSMNELATLDRCTYDHHDHVAVRHLFSVAAGLDSMLVGEPQILGQVRQAWATARDCGTVGPGLSRLFQNALRVGKMARTQTNVSRYHVSLGQATVALASRFFNGRGLSPQDVLIIGAGEVAELVARSLTVNGLGPVLVANRNFERASSLAASLHGRAIRFADVQNALRDVDVVISSSHAPHHVLHHADIEEALAHRQGRPLCLIDIAVPRDIEPSVAGLPGVCLRNIDDLQSVTDENLRRRQREADRAAALVAEEAERFVRLWRSLGAVPVIHKVRDRAEMIRNAEVERALRRLPALSPQEREVIEALSKALVSKVLHPALVKLREPPGGLPCADYLDCVAGFLLDRGQ